MLPPPPADPAVQLQWLVDRAAISDLLFSFARAIDERDQGAYAETFSEDGVVVLPHGSYQGRDAIRAMRGPPPEWGTLHLQGNHQIVLEGDRATVRAYVIATHVFAKEKPSDNASAGGWYDIAAVRTAEGWRFGSVALKIVWTTGEMIRRPPPGAPPAA